MEVKPERTVNQAVFTVPSNKTGISREFLEA
jgi:hypothetical protein